MASTSVLINTGFGCKSPPQTTFLQIIGGIFAGFGPSRPPVIEPYESLKYWALCLPQANPFLPLANHKHIVTVSWGWSLFMEEGLLKKSTLSPVIFAFRNSKHFVSSHKSLVISSFFSFCASPMGRFWPFRTITRTIFPNRQIPTFLILNNQGVIFGQGFTAKPVYSEPNLEPNSEGIYPECYSNTVPSPQIP